VPSFGFSLPTAAPPTSRPNSRRDQKKRVNLGLGEQNAMDDSSSEEDVSDEEKAFAEKNTSNDETFAFEHNGEMILVKTKADMLAYLADRRRNYPTRKRILEKTQEAAAKREHELDFLHRVKGKPRKAVTETRPARPLKPEQKPKPVDIKKQEELAALRKKLHESMMYKQQQPASLLGAGYDSETDSDAESSILSDSSVLSSSSDESSEEPDEEGDKHEESDSDAAPEATSSKAAPPPIAIPPPPPVSAPASQVCKNWSRSGRCRFGKGCRWAHPPGDKGSGSVKERASREGEKKVGLFEKMVEMELEKRDRVALECIKWLGGNGFLG
jgi:hypothetical protein